MIFLTNQERARMYSKYYISTTNLRDYLNAADAQGLDAKEAEVVWESLDQYEDTKPEYVAPQIAARKPTNKEIWRWAKKIPSLQPEEYPK